MKKIISLMNVCASLVAALVICNSCKKPCKGVTTYSYYKPIYKEKAEVKAGIKSVSPQAIKNPGKIYLYGRYIFLNEVNKGIHVIDNSNPAAPVNRSFIQLPGNVDIAMRGNLLYADFYTDLVVIDASNPLDIQPRSFIDRVFPRNHFVGFGPDSTKVIVDWEYKTETMEYDCESRYNNNGGNFVRNDVILTSSGNSFVGAGASAVPIGVGGSLARFALINQHLYTVSDFSLSTFSLAAPLQPQKVHTMQLGWGIETIYPFRDKLFIGSTTGMHICDLQNPAAPVRTSVFAHARACDPVVTDGNMAYVTLRSGNVCAGFVNQMDVVDVTNVAAPVLRRTYPLTNPIGLGKDGNLLMVCDGTSGVRIFDASNPMALVQTGTLQVDKPSDVILHNGVALVVAPTGLLQYDYSNPANIKQLSTIAVTK
jgi:hypothetical protein